jgi:hypothetical protein
MTEEGDFDIDIYGDDGNAYDGQDNTSSADHMNQETSNNTLHDSSNNNAGSIDTSGAKQDNEQNGAPQQITSTGNSDQSQMHLPKQAPVQQGVKRKEGADDRVKDPGATTAVLIQDLHWWNTEDDIRGWANQAECEDELKDITFNEHKVNGKSKGYVLRLPHFQDDDVLLIFTTGHDRCQLSC